MDVHRNASGGFTLIELVTTIVIVGILSAVVAPRFSDNRAFSERGFTDEVASALRYAQRIAVATRCPVQITIDAAGYNAFQQNGCNPTAPWGTAVRRADGRQLAGTAPEEVLLTPVATTIIFDENGGVSGGAAFTVGANFAVTVDGVNGLVTVQP